MGGNTCSMHLSSTIIQNLIADSAFYNSKKTGYINVFKKGYFIMHTTKYKQKIDQIDNTIIVPI